VNPLTTSVFDLPGRLAAKAGPAQIAADQRHFAAIAQSLGHLWSVPAYLRLCAPWLSPEDVRKLRRRDAQAWTVSDLPLLDAVRQRLGDPQASRRKRRRDATVAAERERMARVVDDLIEVADDEYGVGLVTMLRGEHFRDALVAEAALPSADPDRLAGPFAHIIVDEAQELTDAEWQMLLLRCPSRSFTIVGDRAQARRGFTESWQQRLERIGLDIGDPTFRATSRVRSLTPELAKGLEFDLVVLVDPESFGQGIEGAVDRYVAMTRATQRLVILTASGARL
jgi:superfamily I DNA/RNA helicase